MAERLRWIRHALAALLVFPLLGALPAVADAQQGRVYASPITSAFEFKLGPWRPAIDSAEDFGPVGPWEELFGDDTSLLFELEYNRQIYRGIGSFAIGGHLGYSGQRARSLTEDGERGADRTRFDVVPVRVSGVYRFDWMAHELNVPLVPVVKAGLSYYLWWVADGTGTAVSVDEDGQSLAGRGGTAGVHASLGLHLMLDWFAPGMARTFDVNSGVNHSYIFAEYMMTKINDFGGPRSWDLSHNGFFFGIAFEF